MSIQKVIFWQTLRKSINQKLIIILGVISVIGFFIFKDQFFLSTILTSLSIPMLLLIYMILYFAIANSIILSVEMIDRLCNFKERLLIRKIVKTLLFVFILGFPIGLCIQLAIQIYQTSQHTQ